MYQNIVSVTTKQNVRYEGYVYVIDKIKKSIFLKNCRCFGTEDRKGPIFIPVAKNVQPIIEFHNDQILDIKKKVAVMQFQPVTEVDLNLHPGFPIPVDKYPRLKINKNTISEQLNSSVHVELSSPMRTRQVIAKARNQSQSPRSIPKITQYYTNNQLQQIKLQKYQKLLEIRKRQ